MKIRFETIIFLILFAFTFFVLLGCTKIEYINTKILIPSMVNNDCKLSGYVENDDNMSMESFGVILTDTQCLISNIKSRDAYINALLDAVKYHNEKK